MQSKLAHLQLVQAVITRMGSNSFLLKAWSVTLVAALFALAAVYMSFDGVKRFKEKCKRKAKRDAEKALFDGRRRGLMERGYPEKKAKQEALLSMGYKKTDSWRFL